MGLHLLSDLPMLPVKAQEDFKNRLNLLHIQTKEISNQLPSKTQEIAQQTVRQITIQLRSYSDMITHNLTWSGGKPTPRMKAIEDKFFSIINDENINSTFPHTKLSENICLENNNQNPIKSTSNATRIKPLDMKDIYKLGQLAVSFVMLIDNYTVSTENLFNRNTVDLELNNHLLQQGVILLGTVHAWMMEETIIAPKVLLHLNNETETATKLRGTAGARKKMQERNMAIHAEIIKEYEKIKEESPKISKNKAAEAIFKKGVGNLTFIAIRRHIPKG